MRPSATNNPKNTLGVEVVVSSVTLFSDNPSSMHADVLIILFLNSQMSDKQMKTNWLLCTTEQKIIQHMHGNVPCMSNYWSNLVVCLPQCDQKKSPNVYKNCPKMISL